MGDMTFAAAVHNEGKGEGVGEYSGKDGVGCPIAWPSTLTIRHTQTPALQPKPDSAYPGRFAPGGLDLEPRTGARLPRVYP